MQPIRHLDWTHMHPDHTCLNIMYKHTTLYQITSKNNVTLNIFASSPVQWPQCWGLQPCHFHVGASQQPTGGCICPYVERGGAWFRVILRENRIFSYMNVGSGSLHLAKCRPQESTYTKKVIYEKPSAWFRVILRDFLNCLSGSGISEVRIAQLSHFQSVLPWVQIP